LTQNPQALINGDTRRQTAVIDIGCSTPEHAASIFRLSAARDQA
jgi:hypothetical protein